MLNANVMYGSVFLPPSWHVRMPLGEVKQMLGYVPFSPLECWVRNCTDWDGGGSQTPRHPETSGNLKELRMGDLKPAMSLRRGTQRSSV